MTVSGKKENSLLVHKRQSDIISIHMDLCVSLLAPKPLFLHIYVLKFMRSDVTHFAEINYSCNGEQ